MRLNLVLSSAMWVGSLSCCIATVCISQLRGAMDDAIAPMVSCMLAVGFLGLSVLYRQSDMINVLSSRVEAIDERMESM